MNDASSRKGQDTGRTRSKHPGSSLVSRIAASTAVLAASLVVLAIVFFLALHWSFFQGTLNATLRGFSLNLAERLWKDPDLAQQIAERHGIGVVVLTPDRQLAFDSEGQPMEPDDPMTSSNRYWRVDAEGPGGQRISIFWDRLAIAKEHIPLLVSLIVFLLLMVGVTYAFQLKQLRPLRWLRIGVDAVAKGDFKARVPVMRRDEIGQAAEAFNQMTQRVDQMLSDRERLLADVSHELRSPLARIKVALELLPESEKRESIAKDVKEMESLTSLLLERERLGTRMNRIEPQVVDLTSLTREAVRAFDGGSPAVELVAPSESIEISGDAEMVRVLIQNLIDNAVKFSFADSEPVRVSLSSRTGNAEISVSDDGRGIPESEKESIFEPFVKLDPARGHHKGYGLGLNLCRRIVEAHSGTIEVTANDPRGTRVTLRLPEA